MKAALGIRRLGVVRLLAVASCEDAPPPPPVPVATTTVAASAALTGAAASASGKAAIPPELEASSHRERLEERWVTRWGASRERGWLAEMGSYPPSTVSLGDEVLCAA